MPRQEQMRKLQGKCTDTSRRAADFPEDLEQYIASILVCEGPPIAIDVEVQFDGKP